MPKAPSHCIGQNGQGLSNRLAQFLNSRFGDAKRLAQAIECDPRTARNLREGHWPNAVTMQAIVARFGDDVLQAVFAPEIEPVLARLTQEERDLEEKLEAIAARRRALEGRASRVASRAA